MNKIEFPRIGVDGKKRTKNVIQNWYTNNVEKDIENRLNGLKLSDKYEVRIRDYCVNHLHSILLANPRELQIYKKYVAKYCQNLFRVKNPETKRMCKSDFCKNLLTAFGYENYRDNILVDLAMKINLKTCPYCNMHFTLYAEKDKKDRFAKFQFDHFYEKSEYPMLSMSLYNLIPSCSICNHSKSTGSLSLNFHPYYADINKQFKFEVTNPITLFNGGLADIFSISIIAQNSISPKELDDFIKMFSIKHLYSRHKDIAQETFDKAYEDPYYTNPDNFSWLNIKEPDYIKRLWLGTYINQNEIEKRPLTKFIQDLWEQAQQLKITLNP